MGYGDYIHWSAVIRDLYNYINSNNINKLNDIKKLKCDKYGVQKIKKDNDSDPFKILIYTNIKNKNYYYNIECKTIFLNNKYVCKEKYSNIIYFKIISNDYYNIELKIFLDSEHVVKKYCNNIGLTKFNVSGDIHFTELEIKKVNDLIPNKDFIFIQPINHKVARSYPFNKFQKIVDYFKNSILFIQDGPANKFAFQENKLLSNVLDYTGKLTFRESLLLMKHAKLCILNHGGLSIGAGAVGAKALVIYPGYFDPKMTEYKTETSIYIHSKDHKSCGWHEYAIHKSDNVKLCDKCIENYNNFNNDIIINKIKTLIN